MSKVQNYHTKSLYFSEQLTEAMSRILEYPLTIVEAPMGYGKTTAVKANAAKSGAEVLWLTVYDSFASSCWNGFSQLFSEIDGNCAMGLTQLGIPNDSISRQTALNLIEGIDLQKKTVIVLDDYVTDDADMHRFITFLVRNEVSNLHIVITTRLVLFENLDELKLKGYAQHITKEELKLTPDDIARYYRQCGISIKADEVAMLYSYTEGWISALYLCMLNAIKEDCFKPVAEGFVLIPDMPNLLDNAVYSPLSEELRDFMVTICIFDQFTAEQAAYMWAKQNADVLLTELLARNAFISYDTNSKVYRIHNLLTNFLKDKLEAAEPGHKQALYIRAAEWYRKTGEHLAAMHHFYLGQDFEALLTTFEYARSKDINREHKELLIKYMEACPDSIKAKHHFAMLIYAIRLFTFNERELFAKTFAAVLANIYADSQLDEKTKNQLLGEYELIFSFTKYNDIKGMSEHHKKASQLMTGPSAVIDPNGIWTFGSPSVLYLFYRSSGELSRQVSDMILSMPYYYEISSGHGSGAEYIMQAEAYFYQGDFENAEITVNRAIYAAQANGQTAISICARFLQMRLAVLKGSFSVAQDLLQNLRTEIMQRREYIFMHTLDMCEAYIYACLRQTDKIPHWIATGDFDSSRLFFQVQAFSNLIYGRVLLIEGDYLKLLGIAEHFIAIASIFPNLLANIYTYIYMAAANEAIFRHEEALTALKQALDLAMPDHLYMPFVENCDFIKGILEKIYADGVYHEEIARILEIHAGYQKAADQIINTQFTRQKPLSEREAEIAQLAAEGLSNKEIAERLFISTNTVKTQLKSIFEKLGVNSRALLK